MATKSSKSSKTNSSSNKGTGRAKPNIPQSGIHRQRTYRGGGEVKRK